MNGKQIGAVLTVGAAAFSGGIALGHFLAQKRVQATIDAELNRIWKIQRDATRTMIDYNKHDIASTEEVISSGRPVLATRTDPRESPERTILRERIPIVKEYGTGTGPEVAEHILDVETTNIFDNSIPDWDYEKELNERSEKEIYIITYDEFYGDELHYKQDQLTYYKGDDVLVDSLNKPIHKYVEFVGDEMKFGHGSKDPNVVFIRNERHRMEWEIALDLGRYEVEVLGLEVEGEYEQQDLKHSAVQKFRRE